MLAYDMEQQQPAPPICPRCYWWGAHHPDCGPDYKRPENFRCECGNEHFIAQGSDAAVCSYCGKRWAVGAPR